MDRKEEDIFFIYDMLAMQSECDTVEESTLYHQQNFSMSPEEYFMMVGQLVGMVSFTEDLTGSYPSILRLENIKFAVLKIEQQYLLFLGSYDCRIPDGYLKKKLDRFFNVFAFFHGSIRRLRNKVEKEEDDFKYELREISQCYFPFSLSYNSTLNALFTPIPTVEFNKASYTIFIKVNELLEACQRRRGIYCGALLSEDRVITSQFPEGLIHNLMLLKPKQNNLPAEKLRLGFDCPSGISIFKVYLTDSQYNELQQIMNYCPYKVATEGQHIIGKKVSKKINRLGSKYGTSKESRISEHSHIANLNNYNSFSDDSFEEKESTSMQSYDNCKPKPEQSSPKFDRRTDLDGQIFQNKDISFDGLNVLNEPIAKNEDEKLSQRKDLPVFFMTKKLENELDNLSILSTSKRQKGKSNPDNLKEKPENLQTADKSTDTYNEQTTTSEETENKPEINQSASNTKTEDSKQTTETTEKAEQPVDEEKMHEMYLYVQGHSTTLLVLLMPPQKYYLKRLKSLWEMILPQLGDLEAQIRSLISTKESEFQNNNRLNNKGTFLQYDKLREQLRGNVNELVNPSDVALVDAVNNIHHQFVNCPTLKDITLRSSATSVLGHQSHCEELYYQQRGNIQSAHNPPTNSDATWSLDQRIHSKKLNIYRKNVIL